MANPSKPTTATRWVIASTTKTNRKVIRTSARNAPPVFRCTAERSPKPLLPKAPWVLSPGTCLASRKRIAAPTMPPSSWAIQYSMATCSVMRRCSSIPSVTAGLT